MTGVDMLILGIGEKIVASVRLTINENDEERWKINEGKSHFYMHRSSKKDCEKKDNPYIFGMDELL